MEKITYDDDQLLEHVLNDKHMGVLINNGLQNISFNDHWHCAACFLGRIPLTREMMCADVEREGWSARRSGGLLQESTVDLHILNGYQCSNGSVTGVCRVGCSQRQL